MPSFFLNRSIFCLRILLAVGMTNLNCASSTRDSARSGAISMEAALVLDREKVAGELHREREGVVMDIAEVGRDGEDDEDMGERPVLPVDATDAERLSGDPDE